MIKKSWFSQQIIDWQKKFGRNSLPWQKKPTPYRVWISEIMLQQTQVTTVIDYYQRFMTHFPTNTDLAHAHEDQVMALWSGLGYYSRARNLHKTAKIIHQDFSGKFPEDIAGLTALPGIGRSTAAAILALSQGKIEAILDGNVKRVLCRYHAIQGWPGESATEKKLWPLAESHLPNQQLRTYTQGLMDLGATVCTRKKPACTQCPLSRYCQAYAANQAEHLPTPKPRKLRPQKHATLLVLFNDSQQIYLEKRPNKGIWAGLWSLPQIETTESQETKGLYRDIAYEKLACLNKIKHQFSHFQFTMAPLYARATHTPEILERTEQGWYNKECILQLGLSAPVKKLLMTGYQPDELLPTN